MFEKEAKLRAKDYTEDKKRQIAYECGFLDGTDFAYNKAKEDVKHDLMMKLKDEGIVKTLKDSILRNEQLSSQEQQELCAWIECAIDFGENLDECAKELEAKEKENIELKVQIEKMKCCSNCNHFNKADDLEYCWNCDRSLVNSLDNLSREEIIKDEWEIEENGKRRT